MPYVPFFYPPFFWGYISLENQNEWRKKKLKFRLRKGRGSVSEFRDAQGNRFKPGDIVDLPATYKAEKWLEVVKPLKIPEPMVEVPQAELKSETAPKETIAKPKASSKKATKSK